VILTLPALLISDHKTSGGLVLGIAMALTAFLSIGAVVQRNHVTGGLVALNWMLIVDAVIVLVVGTRLWFHSLRQRNEFHAVWLDLTPNQRITIQDMVRYI
jgi:hypothetical protein